MTPDTLKSKMAEGLLSFPVTHFDTDLEFDQTAYQDHVSWQSQFDAAALFAAGGTGELFSLTPTEIPFVVQAAKEAAGDTPIIAGCGYGTKMATELAREVTAVGADGILLLPHYLIGASQDGLYAHIKAVCDATEIGVIIYNRANSVANADTVARLAEDCPNLIGFKDGTGDINMVRKIVAKCGDRLTYIGGMPTHEVFAEAYGAIGVTTYSSAVFNFVPQLALDFYAAVRTNDKTTINTLLGQFYYPFLDLRDRVPGYAVSAIKGGLAAAGRPFSPVRPPLTNLTEHEIARLAEIIKGSNG